MDFAERAFQIATLVGGKNRAEILSPAQRRKVAKKAAKTRWANDLKAPKTKNA